MIFPSINNTMIPNKREVAIQMNCLPYGCEKSKMALLPSGI